MGVAIFLVGFLVIWLVKPIGNPCPDLGSLPPGSSASSSPSFSPPGSRTCTYIAVGGTKATVKFVPWLDWIVLLLLAAAAGGAARAMSPAGRRAREQRAAGIGRPARTERPPRTGRAPRAKRPPRAERRPRAPAAGDPSPEASGERDAAERERARRERAARDRARHGR